MDFEFLYFLNFITIVGAIGDCECEVRAWSDWGSCPECGIVILQRNRICATNNGWTLGLTCNQNDNLMKFEEKECSKPCRKLLKYFMHR